MNFELPHLTINCDSLFFLFIYVDDQICIQKFTKRNAIQVFLVLAYSLSFYMIFHHISHSLLVLREQLIFIEGEDTHTMHNALYAKYIMFKYVLRLQSVFGFLMSVKQAVDMFFGTSSYCICLTRKFQGAMQLVAMAEVLV